MNRCFQVIIKLLGLIWLLTLLIVSDGAARPGNLFSLDADAPWNIEADFLHYNKAAGQYIASGRVIVAKKDTIIHAEQMEYNQSSGMMSASGQVTMTTGSGDRVTADKLELNLNTETGTIYNGMVFQQKDNFHVKGGKIEKLGPDTYVADSVSVSTCAPENPDWHISGRDLDITVDGYGSLWHATLWAKKLPVIYVPYLFFPVKTQRQTGFLVPEIQYSERKWEEYRQPFFWAIDDSSDATFYLHHMERRGQKLGVEYRRVFSEASKLTVMYDGLNDRKKDDDPSDDRFGYDHDTWLRPNASRYWFRAKQDQVLGNGFFARLDIDYVSDQDYLHEFRNGYTGFEKADAYFEKTFGRDLDDYTDTTRTNRFNLNKGWTYYSLNAELRWYDNIIERRYESDDDTAQRLPLIELDAVRHRLGESPVYYDLDSEYTYCYRKDGTKGHRIDIHPRLYLPWRWHNIIAIEPSLGVRETAWQIDAYQADREDEDKTRSRALVDTGLNLSTEIYRLFRENTGTGAIIKHALIPAISHEYVSWHDDQGQYPKFNDSIDTIEEKNRVTYSLTQTLTIREPKRQAPMSVTGDGSTASSSWAHKYREVARLKIEQSYDIKEKREDDPVQWADPDDKRPFSPVRAALDVKPLAGVSFSADGRWCQYDRRWLAYSAKTKLSDNRGNRLTAEYRKEYNALESIAAGARVVFNDTISIYAAHERNLFAHIDISTSIGMLYASECWSLDVSYIDEPDDRRYLFMINLYGLGGLGTDIEAVSIENPEETLSSDDE
jgi:LPS-assembly protein